MANSRYVIFFKFLVCRNIVSEGMHQSEVIISYILILREIRNVLRGNDDFARFTSSDQHYFPLFQHIHDTLS